MKSARVSIILAAAFLTFLQSPAAHAQVPQARPGEICMAGKIWCWKKPPGKPGAACSCPSPFGMVGGTLQ